MISVSLSVSLWHGPLSGCMLSIRNQSVIQQSPFKSYKMVTSFQQNDVSFFLSICNTVALWFNLDQSCCVLLYGERVHSVDSGH